MCLTDSMAKLTTLFMLPVVFEPMVFTIHIHICDTIKGNESIVEKSQFLLSEPLSHKFQMLHFDANPIKIGHLVTD